jgi:hypothetical protein
MFNFIPADRRTENSLYHENFLNLCSENMKNVNLQPKNNTKRTNRISKTNNGTKTTTMKEKYQDKFLITCSALVAAIKLIIYEFEN